MTRPVGFDGPFGFEEPAQPVDAPHRGAPDAVTRSDPAGRESALRSPWCAELGTGIKALRPLRSRVTPEP